MQIPISSIRELLSLFLLTVGAHISCTSDSFARAAKADAELMQKYEQRSDVLADEISRVKKRIASDPSNLVLVARRDSLIARKADVDRIREMARKSAIEKAKKSKETSLLRRSKWNRQLKAD